MTFLAVGADLSALGNVALLGSDLRLFSGWWEVWGTWREQEQAMFSFLVAEHSFNQQVALQCEGSLEKQETHAWVPTPSLPLAVCPSP